MTTSQTHSRLAGVNANPERELTRNMAPWFLGPKAENADLEEEMILHILRDYFHWRRNYFPGDEIPITQKLRREAVEWNDNLLQQISEMLAGLRRHFPVYSPRYNGHMISDQTIPSVLGYFAGLLYNPNNVSPEAAPVTVKWEFDIGADILRMLGFEAPPDGAAVSGTRHEFGWAHVTSGGTVANLEALWAARNIRYFPLAVRDVVKRHGIALTLRPLTGANGDPTPVALLEPRACLGIRPSQAIHLYARYVEAVRRHFGLDRAEAGRKAIDLLAESEFSIPHHGTAACYRVAPPAIFAPGTRHYSLSKIADLLGVGRRNLAIVDVDCMFRLDVADLRRRIDESRGRGMFPLAVIAVAGSTEEGAVDPIHRIAEMRAEMEQTSGESFWLHIDAAWGGYVRSLFLAHGSSRQSDEDRAREVSEFVSRTLVLERGRYEKTLHLQWGYSEILSSFLGFPQADSIIVDPHKLGYVPYPCGVVAFRNDLVRHFITEEAPYISDASPEDVAARHHRPPTSVGPYILEGSKPGSAVAACWLSHRMIPPDRSGYGEIIRASLLGAREFYERLIHWELSSLVNGEPARARFVPLTSMAPDLNVVCFIAVENEAPDLKRTNALNRWLYRRFTIDAEHGDRHYSYSQPFFLSHTECGEPEYPERSMADLLQRAGLNPKDYVEQGLFVLRATVMSPYHVMAAETGHRQSLLAEFVEALAACAEEGISAIGAV
ncbi:MAG: hypothetical protein KGN84_02630 [Acidobacteriota bacterium]|nr:hypothetical protein [Acidobacteriota bacterium]